eukprot:scaffold2682_cov155-Amphora_coffeaeformis.AAC.7
MGCAGSRELSADSASYFRHPPLLEEHVYQLNLPAPPQNGFDSFLTLQWCRDVQEEKEDHERYQKELAKQQKTKAKQKKKSNNHNAATATPQLAPPPKKYYLCLRCKFEPYQDNKTINLQKQKDAWKALPKWNDPDFMEDILANGPFYINDEFLLEHVPTAIRPPAEYAYAEQYKRAYRHVHGHAPSAEEVKAHQTTVAQTILTQLANYRANDNRDAKGRDRSRTMSKLEDILTSMELDVSILRAAETAVQQQQPPPQVTTHDTDAAATATAKANQAPKTTK